MDGAGVEGGLVVGHDDVAPIPVHARPLLALYAEGGPEKVLAQPHGNPAFSIQSQFGNMKAVAVLKYQIIPC